MSAPSLLSEFLILGASCYETMVLVFSSAVASAGGDFRCRLFLSSGDCVYDDIESGHYLYCEYHYDLSVENNPAEKLSRD